LEAFQRRGYFLFVFFSSQFKFPTFMHFEYNSLVLLGYRSFQFREFEAYIHREKGDKGDMRGKKDTSNSLVLLEKALSS